VPIYVYRCDCGTRFERLCPRDAPAPDCPACGGSTRKLPAAAGLGGRADPGRPKEWMPQTWRGTHGADPEYLGGLRRQWERRRRLEAGHPELAGDPRPVLAHEGRFHDAPPRAGDPPSGSGSGSDQRTEETG
jgi:putative FmdB family regulatory protein